MIELQRHPQNPIVRPCKLHWWSGVTFNPGVIKGPDGDIIMLEHAATLQPFQSVFGALRSTNGIDFELIQDTPSGLPSTRATPTATSKTPDPHRRHLLHDLRRLPQPLECLPHRGRGRQRTSKSPPTCPTTSPSRPAPRRRDPKTCSTENTSAGSVPRAGTTRTTCCSPKKSAGSTSCSPAPPNRSAMSGDANALPSGFARPTI